jgi:F0F1-type ATP synthase assembly protein I
MVDKMADKPKDKMTGTDLAEQINLWSLAGELGVKFAAPLIVLMLIGIKLDRSMGTTPLFILVGIVMSLATSVYFVYDMIRRVNGSAK